METLVGPAASVSPVAKVVAGDDKHLHWTAEMGGDKREWDAEITEQHPTIESHGKR